MCKLSVGVGSKLSLFVKIQSRDLRGISNVRQIPTAEPLVPQLRPEGVEIAIETMEMYKSSVWTYYQMTAELI
jgi:hypothetical protein